MPTPVQVEAVALIAEKELATFAPALAERIAANLPEIFGGPSKAAALIAHAPADGKQLAEIAEQYQYILKEFGLPKTATPPQLWEAARNNDTQIILRGANQTFDGATSSHSLGLGNGIVMEQTTEIGKNLETRNTIFSNFTSEPSIWFTTRSALGQRTKSAWFLVTPNISREFAVDFGAPR